MPSDALPVLLMCPLCATPHHAEAHADEPGRQSVTVDRCPGCGGGYTMRFTAEQYLDHGTV